MKIKTKITALLAALGFLTACHDELTTPTYTVGEADNPIVLSAGISEGGSGVMTRAGAEDHHTTPGHMTFSANTKLTLRVDGTWLGKADGTAPHGTISGTTVSQTTTATIGDGIKENTHNEVTFTSAEQLYWDDYGMADPANMPSVTDNGRDKGLTIYGAAINDNTVAAPTISSWTAQTWNVGEPTDNVIDQTGGWSAKDLLTSNNIQVVDNEKPYATDGTYKFQNYIDDIKNGTTTSSNLLEFTHAMTKITVNLTAGEGFPGYETGAANAKFQTAPTVKLLGFNYTGNVNVETKVSTATADTKTDINMHLAEGGANKNKATLDALVFPGNQFTATIAADDPKFTPTSATNILELNADGNIYKVTAAQLVKAMNAVGTTGNVNGTLEQGKNYILNIIVNKTKIEVTATIKDWIDVDADSETPKIDIDTAFGIEANGTTEKSFTNTFDFFRSTTINSGYSNDATVTYNNETSKYDFSTPLYWPDHSTHYFFRGVYPKVGDAPLTPNGKFSTSTSNASTIAVENVKYETGKYPSDLAIGYPRTTDETCTHGSTVATQGICATEGEIRMNFRYVMSQVEVELRTVTDPTSAQVNIDENTIVEIVNVYGTGNVNMSDGSITPTGSNTGLYRLNNVDGADNNLKRHSAIVPQALTFTEKGATTNLRFKITVTNNDAVTYTEEDQEVIDREKQVGDVKTPATTDVYYTDVNPILKTGSTTDKVAPNGKWDSGVHYKYILTLSKTAINVTATLKDWVEVTASDNIWF